MSSPQICPVVGSTTTVLPPNHPTYDTTDTTLKCPVTNATTGHHTAVHKHAATTIPAGEDGRDATECPALKGIAQKESLVDNVCPVVGPVSAYLPADHPSVEGKADDAVCPVTNATKGHHEGKVATHPKVTEGVCPVAHKSLDE